MNIVKDKLIGFTVFSGSRELGAADITLPDIEYMSDTMKGAGINGEVDMPTKGMVGKLGIKIEWRTINSDITDLSAPKAHDLEFRGAQQSYESGMGELRTESVRVFVRAVPKKTNLGKFSQSNTTGSSNEMECVYFKMDIDGITKIEIDKFARVCNINGFDFYADVREALGL